MAGKRPRNYLLLTLDAYETLFHPRLPIATQYAQTARSLGVFNPLPVHLRPNDDDLQTAFKEAFKHEAKLRPNYGRLQPDFKGPMQWWGNVIKDSFEKAVIAATTETPDSDPAMLKTARRNALESLPPQLVPRLLKRFSSREAYKLYDDVELFFRAMRAWKSQTAHGTRTARDKYDQIIVGVVSNSDDRVPDILKSFGLKVGGIRVEGAATAEHQRADEVDGSIPDLAKSSGPGNDIDFVITSYEAGEEKPHHQIFDVAKQRGRACKQSDGTCDDQSETWTYLHVGDDEAKDYIGAVNAGWDSVYLDRNSNEPDTESKSQDVKRIASLTELLPELGLGTEDNS